MPHTPTFATARQAKFAHPVSCRPHRCLLLPARRALVRLCFLNRGIPFHTHASSHHMWWRTPLWFISVTTGSGGVVTPCQMLKAQLSTPLVCSQPFHLTHPRLSALAIGHSETRSSNDSTPPLTSQPPRCWLPWMASCLCVWSKYHMVVYVCMFVCLFVCVCMCISFVGVI